MAEDHFMWKDMGIRLAEELGDFVARELQKAETLSVVSASTGESNVYHIDMAAERYVRKFLESQRVPAIVLSEDSEIYKPSNEPEAVMIIDPLDGSSNAVRGMPIYAISVSIGSLELQKEFTFDNVKIGVVYSPVSGNLYVAEKGGGATRNGKHLQTRKGTPIGEWYVGAIFRLPSAHDLSFFTSFKSFRCFGCATEHLCGISRGSYDAYFAFDEKLRVCDIAAAGLILEESGGVITTLSGEKLVSGITAKVDFLASASPETHETILELLKA